jgi:MEMO1 family protein
MNDNEIRESAVAGSFYPADPEVLKTTINGYLENAETKFADKPKGLICPHAGYIYSGQVAAYSYKSIIGKKFDCIFIIAPSHSEYFEFNSVFTGFAYRTPLGIVEIDRERTDILTGKSDFPKNIKASSFGHRREHSLEVQLPFLQTVLSKNFKIVPVVMGSQSKQNIESLGIAIGNLFKTQNILIIASTDLSHYHPYNTAKAMDSRIIDLIENYNKTDFDIASVIDSLSAHEIEMCGGGPVAAAMIASRLLGAEKSKVLDYKNSGDVSGDRSAVVGYLSAVFY